MAVSDKFLSLRSYQTLFVSRSIEYCFYIYKHSYSCSFWLVHAVTNLFLLGVLLRGYLGALGNLSVLGLLKWTVVLIFFLRWLCAPLNTLFLAFKAFSLAEPEALAGAPVFLAEVEGMVNITVSVN